MSSSSQKIKLNEIDRHFYLHRNPNSNRTTVCVLIAINSIREADERKKNYARTSALWMTPISKRMLFAPRRIRYLRFKKTNENGRENKPLITRSDWSANRKNSQIDICPFDFYCVCLRMRFSLNVFASKSWFAFCCCGVSCVHALIESVVLSLSGIVVHFIRSHTLTAPSTIVYFALIIASYSELIETESIVLRLVCHYRANWVHSTECVYLHFEFRITTNWQRSILALGLVESCQLSWCFAHLASGIWRSLAREAKNPIPRNTPREYAHTAAKIPIAHTYASWIGGWR